MKALTAKQVQAMFEATDFAADERRERKEKREPKPKCFNCQKRLSPDEVCECPCGCGLELCEKCCPLDGFDDEDEDREGEAPETAPSDFKDELCDAEFEDGTPWAQAWDWTPADDARPRARMQA